MPVSKGKSTQMHVREPDIKMSMQSTKKLWEKRDCNCKSHRTFGIMTAKQTGLFERGI